MPACLSSIFSTWATTSPKFHVPKVPQRPQSSNANNVKITSIGGGANAGHGMSFNTTGIVKLVNVSAKADGSALWSEGGLCGNTHVLPNIQVYSSNLISGWLSVNTCDGNTNIATTQMNAPYMDCMGHLKLVNCYDSSFNPIPNQ